MTLTQRIAKLKLRISPGNVKLRSIPSVSLLPIVTCEKQAGCTRRRPGTDNRLPQCYACHMMQRRPNIGVSWRANTDHWQADPLGYGQQLGEYLTAEEPAWFRWHIGGDCPDRQYVQLVVRIAKQYPETRFLCFSKRYAWFNAYRSLPDNLTVVYSAWPGLPMSNPKNRPVAYLQDDNQPDDRIPETATPCPGDCSTCFVCWHIGAGESVVFHNH